jgi:hypothetical protein
MTSMVACDGVARDAAVVTTDSAGIALVRNTRPARDTVPITTPLVRIGHDEAKTESIFREVHHVAFTKGGSIVVIDAGARAVIFDAAGRSPRPLGRKGQGPGEYSALRWALTRGDTIVLWDVAQRRMHYFSESGASLGSLAIPDNREGRTIRPLTDGWLDEAESGQYEDTTPARGFILRRAADGRIRDTVVRPYPIPEIGWQILDPKTGNGAMVNPPALGIAPPWTSDGDRIVWASAREPRVHVRRADGEIERIIELPYVAGAPTDRHRDAFIGALRDRYVMSPEAALRSRTSTRFIDTLPTVTRVVLDDRDNIWLAGFAASEPFSFVASSWDVLDGEGRIVRQVEFPRGFMLHEVRDGRALGIRTLESGVSTVEVYQLP